MKHKIFLGLVIALLLVTACTKQDTKQPNRSSPFVGGTAGLNVMYVDNSPPPEVFDSGGSPFNIVVKLKNMGEYFVPKDKVFVELSGFAPEAFDLTSAEMRVHPLEDLIATTLDTQGTQIPGNEIYVEFQDLNYKGQITGASFTYPVLRAQVCYQYGTVAQTVLCSRKDLVQPEENGICQLNEQKVVFNSGAPVQVTRVAQNPMAKDKVGFQFDVQHLGTEFGGKVFDLGTGCAETFRTYEDKVKVRVKSDRPGLQCGGLTETSGSSGVVSGFVNLYGGKKTVQCTQTIQSPADFEFPVTVELEYDYRNLAETALIIKHAGGI